VVWREDGFVRGELAIEMAMELAEHLAGTMCLVMGEENPQANGY
jgi:hypothetical protein